jgi:hypothetical protein
MDAEQIVVNVLVLVASGSTAVLIGLVLKRLDGVAADVKSIREQVGDHATQLARGEERMHQLRADVNGLLERERMRGP